MATQGLCKWPLKGMKVNLILLMRILWRAKYCYTLMEISLFLQNN